MSTLERVAVRVAISLVLALPSVATAGDLPDPIFCDNFDAGAPCGWTIGPSCGVEICAVGGGCAVDVCDCTPTTPFGFLAGDWAGTWEDTLYEVSGTLEATFTVICSNVFATGTIGLQDLGLGDETGTGFGTVLGQTLSFSFASATVGAGTGTLDAGGPGSGSGSVTAPLSFGAFTFAGTANSTTITGTFDFTSPSGGEGEATLTKQ
jgi:hypothetical protein